MIECFFIISTIVFLSIFFILYRKLSEAKKNANLSLSLKSLEDKILSEQEELQQLQKTKENRLEEVRSAEEKIQELTLKKYNVNTEAEVAKVKHELFLSDLSKAKQQYVKLLEDEYEKAEIQFDFQTEEKNKELQKLKDTLAAGVQAQLREREKEEQINFYKVAFPQGIDGEDLLRLIEIRKTFSKKDVISKLIWSSYFQKQVTDLCNRVVGTSTKCGIYKITNLETKEVYVGQSVNLSERIKQHCKCGLGIDNPASNKLYNNMLKYGLWNFTFEILEECTREELNEKERLWISMYQSDIFGLNSNKGVSK